MASIEKIKNIASSLLIFFPIVGSALAGCVLECLSYMFIRPISQKIHRQIYTQVSRSYFLVGTVLLERWACIKFKTYGTQLDPSKSYLAILNHRSNMDWLLGIAYISRLGAPYPGNAKCVVKSSLAKVPLFGYLLVFAEFLFLARDWNRDKDAFLNHLKSLRTYSESGNPLFLVLYPEGTRLDANKLAYSNEYAKSMQINPTQNVLLPRYKAFTSIVSTLRDQLDGVVDTTFIFEGGVPTVSNSMAGTCKSTVHSYVKYYAMKDLPEGEGELQEWLLNRWYEKDTLIAAYNADPKALGEPKQAFAKVAGTEEPSTILFYALFGVFQAIALVTIYVFSRFPNGIAILSALSLSVVGLVAIFTVINILPSRKGSSKKKQ